MKTLIAILTVIIVIGFSECKSSDKTDDKGLAKLEFNETEFDFGNIRAGEKVAHRFIFKNIGNGNLIIKDVDPSCGCTVASFPNTPIKPGEGSFIDITFDSEGYRGLSIKEIDVFSNSRPAEVKLTISATIEKN